MQRRIRRILLLVSLPVLIVTVLIVSGMFGANIADWLEQIARVVLVAAGTVMAAVTGWEVQSWKLPEPEDPPTTTKVIYPQPLDDAEVDKVVESVKTAEDFSKKASERVQIEIDIEDAQDD